MSRLTDRIREIVKDCNEKNEEVCQNDLVKIICDKEGIAALPTLQKEVTDMVTSGDLYSVAVPARHGNKFLLFVAVPGMSPSETVMYRLHGMQNYNLSRIADALDRMAVSDSPSIPPYRRKRSADGMIQANLNGKWTDGTKNH